MTRLCQKKRTENYSNGNQNIRDHQKKIQMKTRNCKTKGESNS
jgi:hypothetical protein